MAVPASIQVVFLNAGTNDVLALSAAASAGTVTAAPVTSLDFLPTIAALCGATVPSDRTIDGADLRKLIDAGCTLNIAARVAWPLVTVATPHGSV